MQLFVGISSHLRASTVRKHTVTLVSCFRKRLANVKSYLGSSVNRAGFQIRTQFYGYSKYLNPRILTETEPTKRNRRKLT